MPERMSMIESSLFSDCTNLSALTMPLYYTDINRDAFENCSSLEFLIIPNSIDKIYRDVFRGCTSLKHIYVDKAEDPTLFKDANVPTSCTIHWNSTGPSSST